MSLLKVAREYAEHLDKVAGFNGDVARFKNKPEFDVDWQPDGILLNMHLDAEILWADSVEEMDAYLDGCIKRAKEAKAKLKKLKPPTVK